MCCLWCIVLYPEPAPQRVDGITGLLPDALAARQQRQPGRTAAVHRQQQECLHRRQR